MEYETPPWNKPEDIYWCIHPNGHCWGFDTYEAAKSWADFFGGHVEITRANGQMELF